MNLFENDFDEPVANFPVNVIMDAIENFGKATKNLASLIVTELDVFERISISRKENMFQYQIILTSKYLVEYSFQVLRFCYDVDLYPVFIYLQSDIGEELKIKRSLGGNFIIKCGDEDLLLKAINAAFSTEKFKKTVGGLMKIARVKQETT